MEIVWEYILALTMGLVLLLRYHWNQAAFKKELQQKIKKKYDECSKSLQELGDHLPAPRHQVSTRHSKKFEILDLSLEKLLERLWSDECSAMDVLMEYQQKALGVNTEFNCVVERIKEAEDLAKECDKLRKRKEQQKRPLHGLPVSLKESYFLKGYDSTAGMSHYIGIPCKEDAVIVQVDHSKSVALLREVILENQVDIFVSGQMGRPSTSVIYVLKKQGAIPFVRTNIPQTMMIYECSNPIYGQTVNPCDKKRGPGGSSGGEGCIIGAGGSLLGFGSDIGGSIRIPCHMCGVCGLKPTYGRLSAKGTHELGSGQTLIKATTGPLARDVTSLVIAMKALLCDDMFDLDPTVPPIPFRTKIYEETHQLRIGYYIMDGYLKPVPACQRAVMDAKAILERQGHEDKNVGNVMRLTSKTQKVYDWWLLAERLQKYKQEFLSLWRSHKLDALICPGFAYPAVPIGEVFNVLGGVTYTALYNLLDYPAGTVPITKVTKEDEAAMKDYPIKKRYEKFIKKHYSEDTVGLPVGVQCVGLPYQEELVLRVMRELEDGKKEKKNI